MRNLKDIIQERLHITKDTGNTTYFIPNDLNELEKYMETQYGEAHGGTKNNPIDLSYIDFSNIFKDANNTIDYIFDDYIDAEYVNASNWIFGAPNEVSISALFSETNIKWLNVTNWEFDHNIISIGRMFNNCLHLESIIGLNTWDVSNIRRFSKVFYNCKKLNTLDISSWDVSSGIRFGSMFQGMENLKTLDLSKWNMHNAMYINKMFKKCIKLNTIKGIENWDIDKSAEMEDIFEDSPLEKNPPKWYKEWKI